jgi:heme-degrading monooxygenase HmoA
MIARVNSAQAEPETIDALITFSREQLPDAREAPGFKGFYLLADRRSGKIVSISLWDGEDHLQQFQDRGAQLREAASSQAGIAPTPVEMYEVVLQG